MGSHVLLLLYIYTYVYAWACVPCVILSATVPSHDAAFLSLLFQNKRLRLEVFRRLTVG